MKLTLYGNAFCKKEAAMDHKILLCLHFFDQLRFIKNNSSENLVKET